VPRFTRLYAVGVMTLFHAVVLFAVLNLLAWGWLAAFPADPIVLSYGSRHLEAVYPGKSRADLRQLLQETWNRPPGWEPYTGLRERPFHGRFVNVHQAGFRLSHGQAPWPPDPARAGVFVFGGSTTFGYGVADEETIVSGLQDALDRSLGAGRASCYNFGRAGDLSTGERALFELLLTRDVVPRVAVFVDGVNEFAFDAPYLTPRLRSAVRSPVAYAFGVLDEQLPLTRLVARWKAKKSRPGTDEEVRKAYDDPALLDGRIERYLANRRLIQAIAAAYGVRPLFVWQPVPTYRYDTRYHLFGDFDLGANNYSRFGYPRMAARVLREAPGADFLWAADLQVGLREPLYVDQIHYTAAMSRRLGEAIAHALLDRGLLR